MSSALGMNALQSLSTWGVHAKRCSGVPCEKEGAGESVADSKASDAHHRAKDIGRSIEFFPLSMFIIALASIIKADTDIVIIADRNTLAPEFALVAKRQPLELSTPLQPRFGLLRHRHRDAQTAKASHVCPSAGNGASANVAC
jgi:hypothetical protein